jgi:hypothetical protein
MPAKKQETAAAPIAEIADKARLRAAIARAILQSLGEPAGLREVDVRLLWDNRYRANVLVGADAATVRIAHSYYLEADTEGSILSSTPAIKREYGVEGGEGR